jgi:hypothetical protein
MKEQSEKRQDKLDLLSCRYGAPLGRATYDETNGEQTACRLSYVRFTDGCYDYGGAYWGSPANLYWLRSKHDESLCAFYRAKSRREAAAMAFRSYANISIHGLLSLEQTVRYATRQRGAP